MRQLTTLNKLLPGERACVHRLGSDCAIRRRLLDIGLIEGARIECLGISPCGDPAAYRICGAVIALRREDCKKIIVIRRD